MRTGRSNGTTAYTYTYNVGQLSQMTVNGKNVTFSYDASGAPQTMTYDGVTYYYITNPMGDVTGIANESGTQLVFYYYTAYGTAYVSYNTAYQALGATLSGVNPLFYRGYVYDQETGLYYLQSRYYNPKVGRFINADALVSTGQGLLGNNMFAYCLNNPVLFTDPSGEASTTFGAESTASARVPWKTLAAAGGNILGFALLSLAAKEALDAAALVAQKIAKKDDEGTIYTVYFLYAKGDPSTTIIYVGRVKTENYESRMAYHKTQGRLPKTRIDGLTYSQCRGLEQMGMAYFHTINKGTGKYNQIRGVSPTNPGRWYYFEAAKVFWNITGAEHYGLMPIEFWKNWTENEFLNGVM